MFFHDMKLLERVFWLKRIKGSGNPMHEATSTSGSFVTDVVAPLKKLLVNFVPKQDLHGYDKPWAGGAGKNMLDYANPASTLRIDSIVETAVGNFTVTANGANAYLRYIISVVPNQTYCIKARDGGAISGNANQMMICYVYDGEDTTATALLSGAWIGSQKTFTPTSDKILVQLGATGGNGAGVGFIKEPQLELGSTATSFEPYSNICPISGHTEVVTEVCGVNVWDEEWELGIITVNTGTSADGQKAPSTTQIRSKNYMRVVGGGSYYLKCPSNTALALCLYDGSKNFIGFSRSADYGGVCTAYTSPNTVYVMPTQAVYAMFYMGSAYGTTYKNDISINYPSTDHEYHAYNGQSYTTTLGRTVYGGTLDVVSGELDDTMAMIDLSTLTWLTTSTQTADGSQCHYADVSGMATDTANTGMISDRFSLASGKYISTMVEGTMIRGGGKIYVATDADTISGQLCYPLATPQTYQLTRQQINSLVGQNNIITEDGVEVDEIVYMTRLVGSPLLGSPQTEDEPTEETNEEPIEETEEPEGE